MVGYEKIHCCDFNGFPTKMTSEIFIKDSSLFGFFTFCRFSVYNPDVVYIGTGDFLMIWSMSRQTVVKKYSFEYGARNAEEIQENVLLIATWGGVKLLEIDWESLCFYLVWRNNYD